MSASEVEADFIDRKSDTQKRCSSSCILHVQEMQIILSSKKYHANWYNEENGMCILTV